MAVAILAMESESIGAADEDNSLGCVPIRESQQPDLARSRDQPAKRGRPRKNPHPSQRGRDESSAGGDATMDALQAPPVKRGRGRPRKVPLEPPPAAGAAQSSPAPPKRGRGRPKKVTINTDIPPEIPTDSKVTNEGAQASMEATPVELPPPPVKRPVGRPPKSLSQPKPAVELSLVGTAPLSSLPPVEGAVASGLDSPLPQFACPEAVLASPATLDKAGWKQLDLKYVESADTHKKKKSAAKMSDVQPVKRKPGRPRKQPLPPMAEDEVPVVKRKRGRPKKNPTPLTDDPATGTESKLAPPKSHDAEPKAAPVVKRKRGRPPKKPKPEVTSDPDESKSSFVLRFSDSESEGSEEASKSNIAALADRVAAPREQSPLLESTFQESYDEDSDN